VEVKDAVTVSKKGIREIRELEEKGRYVIYLYRDLESGEVKEGEGEEEEAGSFKR